MSGRILACALPSLSVVLAYALTRAASPSADFGDGGGFVGLSMILGVAAMVCASLVGQSGEDSQPRWGRSLGLEGVGFVGGLLVLALIVGLSPIPSRHPEGASPLLPALALVAAAWVVPWSLALPLRALNFCTFARILSLLVAAVMLGSPWLSSQPYDVPEWVGRINPLVRWHQDALYEDWFHGPSLYARVGEGFYTTPAWDADLAMVLLAAALLVGASLALARLTPHRRERV